MSANEEKPDEKTEKIPTVKKRKGVDELLTEVTSSVKTWVAPKPAATLSPVAAAPVPLKKEEVAPAAPPAPLRKIRVTQVKSGICTPVDQKATLKGLGLRRIRHEVTVLDTPSTRGLIHKVRHLVEVKEN